jgi:cobalamin biosynthesis protein CbiM
MHIPDGFIDLPTSATFGALSAVAVTLSLKGAKRQLTDRTAPLAGLTAVFIFAVQMLNFPVAAGTSGHLLGGALAAILVGPFAATLALTVVLIIQALLFADGGLSALGLNIFNISFIAVWLSYLIFIAVRKILPSKPLSIVVAAAIAAFLSVPLSAAGFSLQYALGGTGTISPQTVLAAMISVHILIGIGEAIITALTISAILAARSDLVFGWKSQSPRLEIKS